MKSKKILLGLLLILVGASSYAQVIEYYPLYTWAQSGESLSTTYASGATTISTTSEGDELHLLTSSFLGHNVNNRFAVNTTSGSLGTYKKAIQLKCTTKNHVIFSIVGLNTGDSVTIDNASAFYFTSNNATYLNDEGKAISLNSKVKDDGNIPTNTNTDGLNNTPRTIFTMTKDGTLDLYKGATGANALNNVIIKSKYITLDAMGYTTYCNLTDKNVKMPEGLKAYAVNRVEESKAKLREVDVVEPGNAVILIGTASTKYELSYTEDACTYTGDNILTGVTTEAGTKSTTKNYILKDGSFSPADGTIYISAGQAYLASVTDNPESLTLEIEYPYTINYMLDDTPVKSETGFATEGATVNATVTSPFTEDNQKYYFADAEPTTSLTISATGINTLNIAVRKAKIYSYKIQAVDKLTPANILKDNLCSGSVTEGDSYEVKVGYPRYICVDKTLYLAQKQENNYYQYQFTLTAESEDTEVKTIAYSATDITNVIYLSEGEDIGDAVSVSTNNMIARSSNAKVGHINGNDITIYENLNSNKYYKVTMLCFSANKYSSATQKFNFGGTTFDAKITGESNGTNFTKEFKPTSTDIIWLADGSTTGNNGLDYIYIQELGDATSVTMTCKAGKLGTFCAPFDVTMPENVKAYTATYDEINKNVKLELLADAGKTLAAGTAVILYNSSSTDYSQDVSGVATYSDATCTTGSLTGNLTTNELPEGCYILQTQGETQAFYKVATAGTGALNRCYLTGVSSSAKLNFEFDDASGIEETSLSPALSTSEGVYNLQGMKVNENYKGVVIKNGKKFLIK